MRLLFAHALIATLLLLSACAGHPAVAAEGPVVMVAGIDRDPDSVVRTNRINQRVEDGLVRQLRDRGYRVVDETAVSLGTLETGRSRRDEGEVIGGARAVTTPPVDLLVSLHYLCECRERQLRKGYPDPGDGSHRECQFRRAAGRV